MEKYYMHTLDGKPGFFDGYQVCYAGNRAKDNKLVATLRQIKQEQYTSFNNRVNDCLEDDLSSYGYILVSIEA